MENYFSLRAITEVYQQWGMEIPVLENGLAPNEKVESQIGINIKRNNRLIAAAMTLAEVESTDDLYVFLQTVRQTCQQFALTLPLSP